jgi:hypothetical protein
MMMGLIIRGQICCLFMHGACTAPAWLPALLAGAALFGLLLPARKATLIPANQGEHIVRKA